MATNSLYKRFFGCCSLDGGDFVQLQETASNPAAVKSPAAQPKVVTIQESPPSASSNKPSKEQEEEVKSDGSYLSTGWGPRREEEDEDEDDTEMGAESSKYAGEGDAGAGAGGLRVAERTQVTYFIRLQSFCVLSGHACTFFGTLWTDL